MAANTLGGAKILDGLSTNLKLDAASMDPSRAVMYAYGNVSSSTTWYALAFIESMQGVKRGDKVLQVGVGSGVKCGVNVWQAVRDIDACHEVFEHRMSDSRKQLVATKRKQGHFHVRQTILLTTSLLLLAALALVIAILLRFHSLLPTTNEV
eukprot:gene23266-30495_t